MTNECDHEYGYAYCKYCGKRRDVNALIKRIKKLEEIAQDVVDYFEADYDQPDFFEKARKAIKQKE